MRRHPASRVLGAGGEEAILTSVLVTDARVPAALTAIRSLGRGGFRVAAVGSRRTDPGLLSRYARSRHLLPAADEQPEAFTDALISLHRRLGEPRVIPVMDLTLTVLDRNRERLPASLAACLPAPEPLRAVLDREVTLRTARRLGIPFPKTHLVANEREVASASRELAFPAVVKPRRSRWFTPGGRVIGATADYATTPLEAASALRRLGPGAAPALLQEYHEGVGRGIFLLMRDGEPAARFAHERRLSLHPTGGASARAVAVRLPGEALDAAVALLRDVGWEGPAMVEFLRPTADGPDLLMEVNGRLWGSLALAIRAGVDFPVLWLRGLPGPDAYRVGTEVRHLLGDALHCIRVFQGPPPGTPGEWPRKRDLARLLLPSNAPRSTRQVFDPDDPLPFLGEIATAVRR